MNLTERAKIVRARRDELGLTQVELAIRAKVSSSYVQKLEAGKEERGSRPAHLRAVSAALGFDPEYLRVGETPVDALGDALRRANLTETQAVHILDEYILHAASYRTTVAELMRGALYLWTVEKVVKANNGQLGQEIELVDHEQDPVQANRDHIGKKAAQQVIEAPRVQIRSDTAGKGDKRSS